MKTKRLAIFAVSVLLAAGAARAEDNTSTLITNLTDNAGADYIVGDNGINNSQTVSAGGVLTNINSGYIGNLASASNNWAVVTGGGSAWFMTNNLLVGYFGSGNSLTIASSGRVFNALGYVGYAAESRNNAVTVTGAGSVWTNADVSIGRYGSGNSLAIMNSGTVYSSGVAWIGRYESSSSNSVLVSDPGSLWSFPSNTVRMNGTGNQLTISNGAMMSGLSGFIGYSAANGNNAMLVTGTGSVWSTSSGLTVGYYGPSNQLTVSSGALVRNSTGTIGSGTSSCNNAVLVTGSGSIWTNEANLIVGTEGSINTLTIANSGSVFNTAGHIGDTDTARNNAVTVIGPGSVWTCSADPTVGYYGSGNSLTITNGGAMITTDAYIGYQTNANNNAVTVTGTGSVWRSSGTFDIGYSGAGNTLTIVGGGGVFNTGGYIGYYSSASNNVVTISGSGSVWSNSSNLTVGYYGSGNSLSIADSSMVFNVVGYIGFETSTNNSVLVTDPGTVWSLSSSVRMNGTDNQLTISNRALVQSQHGYIGFDEGTGGNAVLVSDSGTFWSNAASLFVGSNNSRGNRLIVTNGALVQSATARIGSSSTSSNNVALVTGSGSIWSNSANFYVGYIGTSNQLTVSGGALVQSLNGFIGSEAASVNNIALITGSGSVWDNSGNFNVGNIGSGNTLVITNGGIVFNTDGFIGSNTTANGNSAFVTGTGSIWSNRSTLYVGYGGTGNTLTIADNGLVFANNLVAGNGTNNATVNLLGGSLSLVTLLSIQNNATLSGNGTISGSVLVNGTVLANGGGLIFTGVVTNNASIVATNGATIVFGAGVVNNGIMYARGGSLVFNDGLINNGLINSNDTIIAFFTASPTNGAMPLVVSFTDLSVGAITNRYWDFGDGSVTNITDTAITHTYAGISSNTVTLIVSGPDGVSTNIRPNDIVAYDLSVLTWVNSTASGNWSDTSSWSPPWVSDNAATVVFGTGGATCIVDSVSRAVTNLVFNRDADFVLAASGGAQLTVNAGITTTGSAAYTITAPLVLGGTNVWDIGANSSLTIGGSVTGAVPLTKYGSGTITIAGSMVITNGTVNFYDGTVNITGTNIWLGTSNADSYFIRSNSVVNISGYFYCAGRLKVGYYAGTTGIVNQTGGTVVIGGDYGPVLGNMDNSGNVGIYNLYGGVLSNIVNLTVGGNRYTVGIFNMTNGSLYVGSALEVGRRTINDPGGTNYFYQSGGTVIATSLGMGRGSVDSINQFMYLCISNGVFSVTNNFITLAPHTNQIGRIYLGPGANVTLPPFPTVRNPTSTATITFDGATLTPSATASTNNYLGRIDAAYITSNGLNFVAGSGTNITIVQVLQNYSGQAGVLRKFGDGTLTLTTNNTYSGNTRIDGGTLALSGNAGISNSPSITIASGARLDVSGRTGGGMTLLSSQMLRGGGVFMGNLVNQGTVIADVAGGQLAFTDIVTNNGTMFATNGATLEFLGPVVNNGVIDIIYGNTNFHSTFINNGIVLTAGGDNDGDGMSNLQESLAGTIVTNNTSCLRITSMAREGDDVRVTWTAVGGKSYVVQTNSVPGAGFADFSPTIYVPGVGESVTNYVHAGGATNASSFFYRVRLGP